MVSEPATKVNLSSEMVPMYLSILAACLHGYAFNKSWGCDRQHPMKIYDSLVLYGFRFTVSQVRVIALKSYL